MKKSWIVVVGAWFAIISFATDTAGQPVMAPTCGWSVAHFNIFKPAEVVAAWKTTGFVKRMLEAQTLQELEREVTGTPAQFQYDMNKAVELLRSLRSIEMDFPIIAYEGNSPRRIGFEKRNPMDTPDMVHLIAQISLRGVFRSRESITHYQNRGFDAVSYEITHFDNSRSVLVSYVIAQKDWFAPFGCDGVKPRHAVNYVLISNGIDEPETCAHLEYGDLQEHPAPATTPDALTLRGEILTFPDIFLSRRELFPVAEDAVEDPIEE
ncbi:MAG: hypothetical protein KDD51_10400 [Bdellovibrionales bacterium]|nr:hypothetical protein [Bdellovibrionales bacterium]